MRSSWKILCGFVVLVVAAATWAALEGHRRFTGSGPLVSAITVVIPKGVGSEAIARRLAEAGVVPDPWSFLAGTKLRRAALRAGEYAFPAHVSPQDAMRMMAEGRTVVHKLTVAEGLTVKQILVLVRGADFLSGEISSMPEEGTLLPETWHLSRDDGRDEVIVRMQRAMVQALDQAWVARDPGVPLKSKRDAVILASIVERETAMASERPHVASVFLNRLRLGMRLQSDPTVIYGVSNQLGVLDRPISRADLDEAHPWNTYVIDGLPPTPIANPGKASLDAVLHPIDSDDLYFVADGSGGHVFARTLEEHNRNVAAWRKQERLRRADQ